jgi:hypothetical protein
VSTGGARRGRRDNGLDAADYAVAGDVDPRVGEHLLDVLAAGGIAAYLQPSADLNPILRTTTYPARPTDRLYVDRTQLAAAREQLHRLTGGRPPTPPAPPARPEASQSEVDAEWAKIIAGFHTMPAEMPDFPEAESVERPRQTPPMPSATDISGITLNRRRTDPQPASEPSLLDGLDTFGADTPDDDEDRYIPPPPPPFPRISKYAIAGVLGIVVGFILFLRPTLLPVDRDLVTLIGFTAIVAGAVTLVWRLRSGEDDDDFDDGAVV